MITRNQIQADFPTLAGRVYLNTAAEGIPPLAVGQALAAYSKDKLLGMDGRDAHFATETRCREVASQFLGLKSDEVAFCSCSAEAYNLLASAIPFSNGDEVIVNDLDFPSGATPWLEIPGVSHRVWTSQDGELKLDALTPLLTPRTRLVQVSLVSFYNGAMVDWPALVACVRQASPEALLAVDITQALGRVPVMACASADIIISSTHKWSLGIHGGCIVGVPSRVAARLTARVGGWYNQTDPFSEQRFTQLTRKQGAPSFATGMPSFAPIYALEASLRYLKAIGVAAIAAHADPLTDALHAGLRQLGHSPLASASRERCSGIVAFRHPQAARIHAALRERDIHVMHHAGRLRFAVHGYNTADDIETVLSALRGLAL